MAKFPALRRKITFHRSVRRKTDPSFSVYVANGPAYYEYTDASDPALAARFSFHDPTSPILRQSKFPVELSYSDNRRSEDRRSSTDSTLAAHPLPVFRLSSTTSPPRLASPPPRRILHRRTPSLPDALLAAASAGDAPLIGRLLSAGASAKRKSGGTAPLHAAAAGGHVAAVKNLVLHGAEVDGVDGDGRTALHHASMAGRGRVVGILLGMGARTDVVDRKGRTALHYAVEAAEEEEVDEGLGRLRFSYSFGGSEGGSRRSSRTSVGSTGSAVGRDVVGLLMRAGAATGMRDREGDTPLDVALRSGRVGDMNALIEVGGRVTA
ncbi:ankyrin [Trichodelitschia bisporula]|uniref:Ankyrin n=1 Tax=Trichodelitschia bisporula TaxID=703511 RepID=A0A6G1HJZ7_9PEZI|nr:ankyrin [Trichodelitschia bisporula]